jgi:hypothetical protein
MDAAGFVIDGGAAADTAPLLDGAPIAEIRAYHELLAALRQRVDELNISGKTLDVLSGLTDGYFQKLISPRPQRTLGPGMLDTVLGTLGVKLLLMRDEAAEARLHETAAKLNQPLGERKSFQVRKPKVVVLTSATYRKLNQLRKDKLSPERRSEIARQAALARWARTSPDERHALARRMRRRKHKQSRASAAKGAA